MNVLPGSDCLWYNYMIKGKGHAFDSRVQDHICLSLSDRIFAQQRIEAPPDKLTNIRYSLWLFFIFSDFSQPKAFLLPNTITIPFVFSLQATSFHSSFEECLIDLWKWSLNYVSILNLFYIFAVYTSAQTFLIEPNDLPYYSSQILFSPVKSFCMTLLTTHVTESEKKTYFNLWR